MQVGSIAGAGGEVWLGDVQPVTVTAHVTTEGTVEPDGTGSERQRLDVETERIESATQSRNARFGLRLTLYSKTTHSYSLEDEAGLPEQRTGAQTPAMPLFHYGQRIRFPAKLNAPRNFRNPGAFDFVTFLHDQGIAASGSSKFDDVEVLPGFSGSYLAAAISRAHRSIVEQDHKLWTEDASGMMDALLIGERAFLERGIRADFQRTGTYHMLVVSGLHVGVLALCVFWVLRRLGLGEVATSVLAVIAIFIYAALTREGTPVWRAALMFAVYLATRLLYRRRAAMNALGGVALAMMVANPSTLFSASFQMSFLCVVLISGVGVPLLERTIEPYSRGLRLLDVLTYDRSLPPRIAQFRLDLRLIVARLGRVAHPRIANWLVVVPLRATLWGASLIVLSAVMQIGMALPMAYYFHRATSVGIAANLLAIPMLQLLMPAAVIAVALSYLSLTLAKVPALIAAFSLRGIVGTIHSLGSLRMADTRVANPEAWMIALCGISILACIALMRRGRRSVLCGLSLLLASTISLWTIKPRELIHGGMLELTAIDVGQGDSLLVVSPEGKKLLIDGGGLPVWMHSQMEIGEDVVSPYLWTRGFSRIDAIALTHAHADHMIGLLAIIANFHPRELWLPQNVPQTEVRRLLRRAEQYGTRVVYHRAGDVLPFGSANVRVLAPDPRFPVRSGKRNDESLIMKINYGETSMLLEADAERGTERLISSEAPNADVLKVAHHGSASATNTDFLKRVHPRYAVISVGARNVYRHPRPEVLQRLQKSSVRAYRTDRNGATTFLLDGKSVTFLTNPH